MSFKAVVIEKTDDVQGVGIKQFAIDDLMEGDTVVRISHSSLNYKDGLAITGASPVVRRFPMVPGIDFVGIVESTSAEGLNAGDAVLLNGWGTGERHLGGWAQKSRVPGKWLTPLPAGFTPEQAMAVGTAGYTAALCVLALQDGGVTPDSGEIVVSGAAGGVGSVAVSLLASLGYSVVASTGRAEEEGYLKKLGASRVIPRDELAAAPRPLEKELWAGAVDSVGSTTLANILAKTKYGGTVACCGLAAGMDLPTSVAPFILRGITLRGIDSVMAPPELRARAWELLDRTLDRSVLGEMTSVVSLEQAVEAAGDILKGKVRGRMVVKIED
nr:MDR family oxidoreductase [Rhizobium sp. 16-449-1b]